MKKLGKVLNSSLFISAIITLIIFGAISYIAVHLGVESKVDILLPTSICQECKNECPYVNIPLVSQKEGLTGYRTGFSCKHCNKIFNVRDIAK